MFAPNPASGRPLAPAAQPVGGASAMPPRKPHPNVNPGNQFQAALLNRLRSLSPQDKQALLTGISPQAMMVLRKLLPELSHLMNGQGGAPKPPGNMAPGGPPSGGASDAALGPQAAADAGSNEQEEAPPPPDGATPLKPAGIAQPKTKLGGY